MAYRLPPLSTFRTFEAAARHLSFKMAAEELHVTPSAVSQQIKHLEAYLETELFRRAASGLQLTEDGMSMIQSIRDGLDCFAAGVERTQHGKCCSLDITAPPAFAARWLVPRLPGFSAIFPDMAIRVSSDPETIDGPESANGIRGNDSDPRRQTASLMIRFGTGAYPGYRTEKLLSPKYVMACSPKLSEGPPPLRCVEDLRSVTLLHDESIPVAAHRPSWREWFERAGLGASVNTEYGPRFSNAVLVHEAVLEGQGVALVIEQHIDAEVASGRLIVPFTVSLPSVYDYFIVMRKDEARNPTVRAFADWILSEVGRRERSAPVVCDDVGAP